MTGRMAPVGPVGRDVAELLDVTSGNRLSVAILFSRFLGLPEADKSFPVPTPGQVEEILKNISAGFGDETLHKLFERAHDQAASLREHADISVHQKPEDFEKLADFLMRCLDKNIDCVTNPDAPIKLREGERVFEQASRGDALLIDRLFERFMGTGEDLRTPLATPKQIMAIIEEVSAPLALRTLRELRDFANLRAFSYPTGPIPGLESTGADFKALGEGLNTIIPNYAKYCDDRKD